MKNKNKQLIFIELNEVPKQLIERYKKKSRRFSELIKNFKLVETIATDKVHLSPWITWPTVHRGVDFDKHKIQNLGQDLSIANQQYKPIWEVLKDFNIKVGVYGSLHSSSLPKDFEEYDFYLPDPFSSHSKCHPNDLENIQKFQLDLTRKSGRNVERQFGGLKAFKVLISLFSNGIRFRTLLRIIKQLIIEIFNKSRLSRRRIIQTAINFDLFYNLLKSKNPNFSTFFTNHVASSMHRYWEASFPNDYQKETQSHLWKKNFRDEINVAMKLFEDNLFDLFRYANSRDDCEIWICSSMGQKPIQNYELISSQLILEKPYALLKYLNLDISKFKIKPTMVPRTTFISEDRKYILELSEKLKEIKINNINIEQMVYGKSLTIRLLFWNVIPVISRLGDNIEAKEIGMRILKIQDKAGMSAYHVPEGILMVPKKNKSFSLDNAPYKTNSIYKRILETFGIKN